MSHPYTAKLDLEGNLWPISFNLNQDHCADVILTGAYDCPVDCGVVLDIGANVGAFARWASARWPKATINSYEPHPFNYSLLKMTVKHFQLGNVVPHEMAVSDTGGTHTLYENGFNCGEWSFIKFDQNGSRQVEVPVLDAIELPAADFLKIDTEGMEPNIIKRLADADKIKDTKAVVLEYHAAVNVAPIMWMLYRVGFRLYDVAPHLDHRGILKFVK